MKTKKTLFILTTVLVLIFNVNAFSQDAETHYITLYVNTSTVNTQNASAVSSFGQEEGITNENFTISARRGDIIVWQGLSSSSEYDVVNIVSINYQGGTNIFNRNVLRGNGESPEKVVGTVVSGNVGDTIKYQISFTVLNNGTRRRGTYNIDPKIQVKG